MRQHKHMEEAMTNRQLQLMLHMVRILNRELHAPDKLDAALKEVEKTLENEPTKKDDDATTADQS